MKSFFVAAALFSSLLSACGSVDAAIDCHTICARYSDCFDAKYDVATCETRCRSHSADDKEYRSRANQCEACINDRACTSTIFSCGVECSTVVP